MVGHDALDAGDALLDAELVAEDAGPLDAQVDAEPPLGPFQTLPWTSGVHYGNEPASYREFASFRDRPIALVTLYVDRNSWQGLVNPSWWFDNFADFPARFVLNEPLYPIAPTPGNNRDCAAGMYDAEWRKLGTFLGARAPDTIIRLGWGPTDPTHEWRADADPANYIACFRRIVFAVRAGAPRVQFDFSFDPLPASADPYAIYPGDDVVDIIGMDVFDREPPTRDESAWRDKCHAPLGLCTLMAFARAHQKRFSVGEWGVATCGADAGGDNPFFIERMVRTFAENADLLAYEAYFDDSGEDVCSSLMARDLAPAARAAYRRLYQRP